MVKEYVIIVMVINILVHILIILEMEMDIIFFQMEILMKEIGKMEKQMEMENLILKMVIFMKENLKIILFLVKGNFI